MMISSAVRDKQWSRCLKALRRALPQVAAGSFGIVSPSGAPLAAHAVRRPKGPDLLRVAGELPRPDVQCHSADCSVHSALLVRDPADSSCLARPNVDMRRPQSGYG